MKTTRTKTIHKRINTGHLIVHLALLAGIVVNTGLYSVNIAVFVDAADFL